MITALPVSWYHVDRSSDTYSICWELDDSDTQLFIDFNHPFPYHDQEKAIDSVNCKKDTSSCPKSPVDLIHQELRVGATNLIPEDVIPFDDLKCNTLWSVQSFWTISLVPYIITGEQGEKFERWWGFLSRRRGVSIFPARGTQIFCLNSKIICLRHTILF